jgi:hypothetical protein
MWALYGIWLFFNMLALAGMMLGLANRLNPTYTGTRNKAGRLDAVRL